MVTYVLWSTLTTVKFGFWGGFGLLCLSGLRGCRIGLGCLGCCVWCATSLLSVAICLRVACSL